MAAAPAPPSVGSAAKVASEDGLTLNPGTLTVAQLQVRLWLFEGGRGVAGRSGVHRVARCQKCMIQTAAVHALVLPLLVC